MSSGGLRVDKWLWHARFFKSRSLAQRLLDAGRLRINGNRVTKSHALVSRGDVLTFPKGPDVRVVRVEALGTRRGPASEAAGLYEDLAPIRRSRPKAAPQAARRDPGSGRPTKSERRATDRLKGR